MSFLDFSQKVNHSDFPLPTKIIALIDRYVLRANLCYPTHRPNWLTCGAMAVKFGRVALPVEFKSLSIKEQQDSAVMLASEHFKQYYGKLPYKADINSYVLYKNNQEIFTIPKTFYQSQLATVR